MQKGAGGACLSRTNRLVRMTLFAAHCRHHHRAFGRGTSTIEPNALTLPSVTVATLIAMLLALGAAMRITRFITADYLADDFRGWVMRRFGADSKLATLVECPWCVSIWATGSLFALAWAYGDRAWFVWPAAALTASQIIGLVAQNWDGE